MIKFTKLHNPTSKYNKKADPDKWFIYKTKLMQSAAFYKVAGGVGGKVLDYMLWKQSMNGNHFIPLPNDFFEGKFGIKRQRKSEALNKLEAAELIKCIKQRGKSHQVALIKYIHKEDTNVGKENK